MTTHKNNGVSRRSVLRYSAAGAGLAALGPWGSSLLKKAAAAGNQKHVVLINLFGGNDGLNMIVPTLAAPYGAYATRRPTIKIDPNTHYTFPNATDYPDGDPRDGKTLSDFMLGTDYVAHPALNRFAGLYQDGDAAVVNMVGYPNANLSHFTSADIWSRGVRGEFAPLGVSQSGWIARLVERVSGQSRGAISVGVGRRRDFVGTSVDPLALSRASNFRFDTVGGTSNHNFKMETIRSILTLNGATGAGELSRNAMDQAHQLVDEVGAAANNPTSQDANYTGDTPSRQMEDIARLIQANFPTCVYYTGIGGFDTHGDQGNAGVNDRQGRLFRRLDDAIGVFSDDMKAQGKWDDTVIIVMSEFGRRNFENGSNGTDHGHGAPVLLAGGALNAGVYGADVTADLINDNSWMPYSGVDFRDIYKEILTGHLNVSPADMAYIFPETQDSSQTFGLI